MYQTCTVCRRGQPKNASRFLRPSCIYCGGNLTTRQMKGGMGVLNKRRLISMLDQKKISENMRAIIKRKLAILKRDKEECVNCHSKHNLTIDNKLPRKGIESPSRQDINHYKLEDCETLCVDCHKKITQKNRQNNYPQNYPK